MTATRLGASVEIVGHSIGADTAVDLASDKDFNGGVINITHVIAAAYPSEPQLPHVQSHTQVAVIQNIYDMPVLGEAALAGDRETANRLAVVGSGEAVSVDVTVPDEIRHPPNSVVPQSDGAN